MKIKDVVCAAGSTGFYFDDQRAIKRGAGHDGMFYIGQPVTEGFSAVRMKGEAVSVMIVLEDGQIAFGDCAPARADATRCFWQRTLSPSSSSMSARCCWAGRQMISAACARRWRPSR